MTFVDAKQIWHEVESETPNISITEEQVCVFVITTLSWHIDKKFEKSFMQMFVGLCECAWTQNRKISTWQNNVQSSIILVIIILHTHMTLNHEIFVLQLKWNMCIFVCLCEHLLLLLLLLVMVVWLLLFTKDSSTPNGYRDYVSSFVETSK